MEAIAYAFMYWVVIVLVEIDSSMYVQYVCMYGMWDGNKFMYVWIHEVWLFKMISDSI